MRSLEIDAGCFGCSYLKFNGIVKMPSEDGYDCMKCNIRVIDFFMIKNGSSEEAMKKLLELGFEEGFKIGLHQLEGIINA